MKILSFHSKHLKISNNINQMYAELLKIELQLKLNQLIT
jgi:hypothetical protein